MLVGEEAKVINVNESGRKRRFQPLDAKKKVVMKTFEEVAKEEKVESTSDGDRVMANLFRKDFR